jgi:hypothetical protein
MSFTPIQRELVKEQTESLQPALSQKIILFDTETDDFDNLPKGMAGFNSNGRFSTDSYFYPRILSVAWLVYSIDETNKVQVYKSKYYVIKRLDITTVNKINKLGPADFAKGHDLKLVLREFLADMSESRCIQGYNLAFDLNVLKAELCQIPEFSQFNFDNFILNDVMLEFADKNKCRWHKLGKAFEKVFLEQKKSVKEFGFVKNVGKNYDIEKYFKFDKIEDIEWHDARADVFATMYVYVHLYNPL